MEISIKWIVPGIILFIKISLVVCFYPEYYIEDFCKNGNDTIVFNTSKLASAATVKSTAKAPYKPNKHCKIVIQAPTDHGIVLSIRKIDFRRGLSYDCEDYLKVYVSDTFESPKKLCSFKYDLKERLSFFTRGYMTVLYHTEVDEDLKYNVEEGFTLTYTSVYLDIQDCKHDNIFMCDNGRCIPKDLTCDGRNNCGDRSDESEMLCDNPTLNVLKITDTMYALIFATLILILFTGFIVMTYKRKQIHTDTESLTDSDEPTTKLAPYKEIHPHGFFICQNYPNHSKTVQSEGGFTNPCDPNGVPLAPPPYSQ